MPGDPTSLRNCSIRAQAALVESAGSEQEAEKELQAVEDNVPGWMTQFPSSVLTDTLRVMDQQAKLAEALPEKKLVRADGAARPTPEVAVDPARGTHPAGSALQAATSGMAASGESVSPAEMERRVLERGTAVAVGKAKNQSSGGEKTENDPVLAQEAGRLAADLRRAAARRSATTAVGVGNSCWGTFPDTMACWRALVSDPSLCITVLRPNSEPSSLASLPPSVAISGFGSAPLTASP